MKIQYKLEGGRLVTTPEVDSPISVYVKPTEEEKLYLVQELKLDEHTLASALDPDESARLEFEPEHHALIFKVPLKYSADEPFIFRVTSVGAFLFKGRLVIVSAAEITPIIEAMRFKGTPSLEWLVLRLFYRSIYSFIEHLKVISTVSDELQMKITVSMDNRYLINLFSLQKSLVYYLNFINSNGTALQRLSNHAARIGFSEEEKELLDDILIENSQCRQQAEIYSNILASLMDARASIVSNNLNIRIKLLTIITIGIMVPTLIVSAFSMNVPIPLQHHPWSFWFVMGLATVSALGLYLMVRWEKL